MDYLNKINALRFKWSNLDVTLKFEGIIFICHFTLNGRFEVMGSSSVSMEFAVDRCIRQFEMRLIPDSRQTELGLEIDLEVK